MKQAAPDIQGQRHVFEQSCAYCGARFRVHASHLARAHRESYACPECGKRYELDADAEPEVLLLGGRRDGKDDQYQETLF
jgi:uncharacterized Zn-finger protein